MPRSLAAPLLLALSLGTAFLGFAASPDFRMNNHSKAGKSHSVKKPIEDSRSCCGAVSPPRAGVKSGQNGGAVVVPIQGCAPPNNTPFSQGIGQSGQERITITVDTSTRSSTGGVYSIEFLNSAGEVIAGDGAAPSGCNQLTVFGPFCGVAQSRLNIASVRILNGLPNNQDYYPVKVNTISVARVVDPDVKNTGSTDAAQTSGVKSLVTLAGSVAHVAPEDPDQGETYKVHLEKGQTLLANGWASAANPRLGATFSLEIAREGASGSVSIAGCAPYESPASFRGGFTNAGETSDFIVTAKSLAWKVCKYKVHLSVDKRNCPPAYACPCPLDGGQKAGVSGSFPVHLGFGREQSEFAPDLMVSNRVGPDVVWQRHWYENLALARDGSGGFSSGWTHPYDLVLNGTGTDDLQLLFPNGGIENLVAQIGQSGEKQLVAPMGAPYFVRAEYGADGTTVADTSHFWRWVELVWDDGSVMRFAPKDDFLFRLVKTSTSTGQNLFFNYDGPGESENTMATYFANSQLTAPAPYVSLVAGAFRGENPSRAWRLKTIVNDAGEALLTLDYRSEDGKIASVSDFYGRKVFYSWTIPTDIGEPCLTGVSQIFHASVNSQAVTLDSYGYQAFRAGAAALPLLKTISRVHPNGSASGTVTATNAYDAEARVTSTTDANGHSRSYVYGTNQTQVVVRNASSQIVQQWTQFMDGGRNGGIADASGQRTTVFYDDPNNPFRATRTTDPMGRETRVEFDQFGHVTKTISPRGVVTTSTYNYSNWRLGRLQSVQITAPVAMPPTTFTYLEPSGLIDTVTSPHPNGAGTVTTDYDYDSQGNLLTVVEPASGTTPARTTSFSYTSDEGQTFPMRLGQPVAVADNLGHTSHVRYDTRGNVISERDALGFTTTTQYDIFDRTTKVLLPATGQTGSGQSQWQMTYSFRGGPLKSRKLLNESNGTERTITVNFGKEGELLSESGNVLSQNMEYDALYRMIGFYDGGGTTQRTRFFYNADGRLSETRYPSASTTTAFNRERTLLWDASGLPLQNVDGNGTVSNIAYTSDGLVQSVSFPASPSENVTLGYDVLGRLSSRSDQSGSETMAYNPSGGVQSVSTTYRKADGTAFSPWTNSYAYNADGSRQSLTTPMGVVNYGYDGAGRPSALSGLDGQSTNWRYLDNDWLQSQTLPVGVQSAYALNARGQTLALANNRVDANGVATELLSQWGHATDTLKRLKYKASGQLVRHTALPTASYDFAGETSYSYDTKAQMAGEVSARGASYNQTFAYSGAGNATSWKGAARTFNTSNQETTGGAFAYNGDGTPWKYLNRNLANTAFPSGQSQRFLFNNQGQLKQVNAANSDGTTGALLSKSVYRGDGKRAWKESATGVRIYFFYDGDAMIAWSGETANSSSLLLWGADGLIGAQSKNAQGVVSSNYHLYDAQGNLAQTVSGAGIVSQVAAYTAWGEVVPRADGTKPGVGAFGYGAKFGYWREGESGFYLCTLRFFDPASGRWLTRDPIGFAGGANLYGYVSNDPATLRDPSGLIAPIIAAAAWGASFFGWGNIAYHGSQGHPIDGGNIATAASLGAGAGVIAQAAAPYAVASAGALLGGSGGSRPGGVEVNEVGNNFVKQVNTQASPFWQWYGRKTLEQSANALGKLGTRAAPYTYEEGRLTTCNVGQFGGTRLEQVKIGLDVTRRLATPFHDAWNARNIGANGQVFDPVLPPGGQIPYWAGTGLVTGAGGAALYNRGQE